MSDDTRTTARRLSFVTRHAPHGTILAQEALEVVLLGAAFDQRVCLVFIDDGVFQIKRNQDTARLQVKNFSPAYRALPMYEPERIVVERESMQARGLHSDDLLLDVEVLDANDIGQLLDDSDVIMSF